MPPMYERGGGVSATRPWVDAFADEMEAKLDANRHKGNREGWSRESVAWLVGRLKDELRELEQAIKVPELRCNCREIDCPHSLGQACHNVARENRIIGEAADVANYALMIADVAGGLRPRRGTTGAE